MFLVTEPTRSAAVLALGNAASEATGGGEALCSLLLQARMVPALLQAALSVPVGAQTQDAAAATAAVVAAGGGLGSGARRLPLLRPVLWALSNLAASGAVPAAHVAADPWLRQVRGYTHGMLGTRVCKAPLASCRCSLQSWGPPTSRCGARPRGECARAAVRRPQGLRVRRSPLPFRRCVANTAYVGGPAQHEALLSAGACGAPKPMRLCGRTVGARAPTLWVCDRPTDPPFPPPSAGGIALLCRTCGDPGLAVSMASHAALLAAVVPPHVRPTLPILLGPPAAEAAASATPQARAGTLPSVLPPSDTPLLLCLPQVGRAPSAAAAAAEAVAAQSRRRCLEQIARLRGPLRATPAAMAQVRDVCSL